MNQPTPIIALFPGTFDPITNGHLDVIRRAQGLFGQLIVALGQNPEKELLFTLDERREMIERIVREQGLRASVESYSGLTVDYARRRGASVIVRGLRNVSDLQSEFQLALTNRAIADVETLFLMTAEQYGFTSSSLIKQIAAGGAGGGGIDRLAPLLPEVALEALKRKHESMAAKHRD